MRRDVFEVLIEREDFDHRTVIRWRSRLFGVNQAIALREGWGGERRIDPRRLATFIEQLVGRTFEHWADLHVNYGPDMAAALLPVWEREIYAFMERLEYQAIERTPWMGYDLAAFPSTPKPDSKAQKKARALLISNLSKDQIKTFEKNGEFVVTAKDGKTYTIKTARSFNVVGPDGARYCGQLQNAPVEDQMLAQKLLLEHEPQKFLKNANVSRHMEIPTLQQYEHAMVSVCTAVYVTDISSPWNRI